MSAVVLAHEADRASSSDAAVRYVIGVSWGLRAVTGAFVVLAAVSAFMSLGAPAALAVVFTLSALAYRREKRQPVAVTIGQDGSTLWNRLGDARYERIIGCAQWSNCVLALTFLAPSGRRWSCVFTADALSAGAFRELAVRARRCSQEHL